ncbi:MAG TPA: type II TA system antitoxin MqsA family protein [Longimicrobium sp.]|jgi:putative zinc finger/helix-turn-helix YgiT family protein|nr:type II TA system antitoxin MqsA family protein [Longimicrobium sp.]
MENRMDCPVCGGEARLVSEPRTVPHAPPGTSARDEFYRCERCGETFYTPGMMDASLRAEAEAVRAATGLLSPAEVKEIRGRLGLTQPEFERLLGVGKNTVVRWERGTIAQGAAADSLLRLVARSLDNARYLAELHGVELAGSSS